MKRVCIVIVTWNNKNEVLANLESLKELTYPNHYTVVVDNASTDGTSDAIKETYPDVTILQTKENLGGSGGFNVGLRHALDKKDAEYIWMLDSDVIVDKNALTALVEVLNSDPQTGVVGSRIYVYETKNIIQEQGADISFSNEGVIPKLTGLYDDRSHTDSINVDYVPACSLLTRSESLKKAGIMDERFFLYWDDMDLCIRIKQSGYSVKAIANSHIWHKFKGLAPPNPFRDYYFFRNKCYFFEHYNSIGQLPKSSFNALRIFWKDIYYWAWLSRIDIIKPKILALFHYLYGKRNKVTSLQENKSNNTLKSLNLGNKALVIMATRPYTLLGNYKELKSSYPNTKITICLDEKYHLVFKNHNLIDADLIAYPHKSFCVTAKTDKFRNMLREKGFDTVLLYCSNSFFDKAVEFSLNIEAKKVYRISFNTAKYFNQSFFWKIWIYKTLVYSSTLITYPIFLTKRIAIKVLKK